MRYNNLMTMNARSEGVKGIVQKVPLTAWIFCIMLLGIGWKVIWLAADVFPFNADEAITGLMARHILQGEYPVFFYGQAYMGSLDAFLVAGLFGLMGEGILPIRVLQIILYSCTIITTASLGQKLTGDWNVGLLAALLMAVPTVNVTLYSTVSLGGYGEALLFATCAFLLAIQLQETESAGRQVLLISLLGLISGVGFWVFGLTLVATVPAVLFSVVSLWQRRNHSARLFPAGLLGLAIGFLIGSFPWWQASLQTGLAQQINELFGSAVSIETGGWLVRTANHLFYFVFLGLPAVFGFRPPWEVRWLGLPLLPFILIGWGLAFCRFPRLLKKTAPHRRRNWYMLIASVGLLTAGYVFTSFGLDPSGRYFLPMAVPFSLMVAWVILSSPLNMKYRCGLILLLVIYQAVGTIQSAGKIPPGITTQFDQVTWIDHRYDEPLMDFLRDNNELRGYSNYWVAYPLAFKSGEQILFSPRLPYHPDLRYTSRDDRIPEYTRQVEMSESTAYITTFNPALDEALRKGFQRLHVTWQEEIIGDFHIYYRLNRPVHPGELESELTPLLTASGS